MVDVYLKLKSQGKTLQEMKLSLNAYGVPRLKEKIAVDNNHYTVTSVLYNAGTEETTGTICIDCIIITAEAP